MAEFLWTTDPHFDHLRHPDATREFGRALRREHPDAAGLIVTGDIAESRSISPILRDLSVGFDLPVYFVLGNHDFYMGSFERVRRAVAGTAQRHDNLHWLRNASVRLNEQLAIAGTDGWYDARNGDRQTDLQLTDFSCIAELFAAQDESRETLLQVCAQRADEEAALLRTQLDQLLDADDSCPTHIIVATHVPPFQQAAWHDGKPSDARWAPFFSSKVMGEMLSEHATRHPKTHYSVLCGHTHGAGSYRALGNLVVHTGAARYGAPELAGIVSFDQSTLLVRPVAAHVSTA
jgi:predicted phosphohydrolase